MKKVLSLCEQIQQAKEELAQLSDRVRQSIQLEGVDPYLDDRKDSYGDQLRSNAKSRALVPKRS